MPLRHLTPRDQELFWRYGRGPTVDVPDPLIHHAVERHAAAAPHAVAAEHRGATLTYGELNRYADALAARLAHEGVRPGDHVGLYLENCSEAAPWDEAIPFAGVMPHALDPDAAERLWAVSEETTGARL